jgi:hypothetical protein
MSRSPPKKKLQVGSPRIKGSFLPVMISPRTTGFGSLGRGASRFSCVLGCYKVRDNEEGIRQTPLSFRQSFFLSEHFQTARLLVIVRRSA